MRVGKITDYDKLVIIAQTYSYINGAFTPRQLLLFIQKYNYKFHSEISQRRITQNLKRSSKFDMIKNGKTIKFEAI